VWGPVGRGVEPSVRAFGKLAPETRGIKIRLGKINLVFYAKILDHAVSQN